MADVRRLLRETIGTPYYRRHLAEIVPYALSKFAFHQSTTDPVWLLRHLELDAVDVLAGYEAWKPWFDRMLTVAQRTSFAPVNVPEQIGMVQYGVVRGLKPKVVIETGVGAGCSTSFLGAALVDNGEGILVSIDLPPSHGVHAADGSFYDWSRYGIGWAMPPEIRDELGDRHRIVLGDVRTALPEVLGEFGEIDCYVHDDLHTPDHMRWQFDLVWPALRPGGVLLCDDINHAWRAFGASIGRSFDATINVDRFGALRKPA